MKKGNIFVAAAGSLIVGAIMGSIHSPRRRRYIHHPLAAIREFTGAMRDRTGNLPPMYGIFPDYAAPIVKNQPEGRELTMARWGMPSKTASPRISADFWRQLKPGALILAADLAV